MSTGESGVLAARTIEECNGLQKFIDEREKLRVYSDKAQVSSTLSSILCILDNTHKPNYMMLKNLQF